MTLFAISKAKYLERLDMELARRALGYVPQDVWPEGLPFSGGEPVKPLVTITFATNFLNAPNHKRFVRAI